MFENPGGMAIEFRNFKATLTDLRNLIQKFSIFSLAFFILFYFTFGPKKFRTSVNGKIKRTSEQKS